MRLRAAPWLDLCTYMMYEQMKKQILYIFTNIDYCVKIDLSWCTLYRLHQYYESKFLHKPEANRFSTAHRSLKPITVWTRIDRGRIILNFDFCWKYCTILNSWASPLAATARTIRELVLYKGSYISRLYGILMQRMALHLFILVLLTNSKLKLLGYLLHKLWLNFFRNYDYSQSGSKSVKKSKEF